MKIKRKFINKPTISRLGGNKSDWGKLMVNISILVRGRPNVEFLGENGTWLSDCMESKLLSCVASFEKIKNKKIKIVSTVRNIFH